MVDDYEISTSWRYLFVEQDRSASSLIAKYSIFNSLCEFFWSMSHEIMDITMKSSTVLLDSYIREIIERTWLSKEIKFA